MRNLKYWFILMVLTISYSCKKEQATGKEKEYQETRNARITEVELTDKNFRQYFIYGDNGLLDSVKCEGETVYPNIPEANTINVFHETDYIRFFNFWDNSDDGLWRGVKLFHQQGKIIGGEFIQRLVSIYPDIVYGNRFNFSSSQKLQSCNFYMLLEEYSFPYIKDVKYETHKIKQYNVVDMTLFENYYFNGRLIENLILNFAYKPYPLISHDLKKLINNSHVDFVYLGERVERRWENLVYGLSGYELPMKEENEIISEIRIRGYSKEDNTLLLDSTVTFDYQVDTLNRKISFGNQIISYEFVK